MNYKILSDTTNPVLLDEFDKPVEIRPHVGDLITIKRDAIAYKITRSEPTDNPSTVTVNYFVVPEDTLPDPSDADETLRQGFS